MPLLTIEELSLRYQGPPLLDEVSVKLDRGDRIGLLGRNGAGKTSFMKLIAGDLQPDHGSITWDKGVRVARLVQDVPRDTAGSVHNVIAAGLPADDAAEPWQQAHRQEKLTEQMQLDADADFATLSSGMKRRVLLARALVSEPDLLLLDEPTNHLDIAAILWLEGFLQKWPGTLLFVTHDRTFLQNLANRIWEIDRGRLFDWSCDYETFLARKEEALAAEEKQQALFDKKLAEEEAWIRQGIKARRTRNEGRVRALKAMRQQRRDRPDKTGTAKMQLQTANRSGQLVIEAEAIRFGYGDRVIVDDFSTQILRGDKVGIIGPNGAGKTTLLKLLLGRQEPDEGSVRLGTNLEVLYFDQLRDQLDPEQTVQENVGDGSDRVRIGDKTKHIIGYLQDFLFTPERARTKVGMLSGGEQNRVLLAKLLTKPANVLVLDEPTNDLDAETLDLLEELLSQFAGTVLIVSHDRSFLNNVVTSTIVFEATGVHEYVGGYDDWQRAVQRRQAEQAEASSSKSKAKQKPASDPASASESKARKLSYNEQRELAGLPERIEQLDVAIAALHETMAAPDYYQQDKQRFADDQQRLQDLESELASAYERWEHLEAMGE